jgi:hypothetical protein
VGLYLLLVVVSLLAVGLAYASPTFSIDNDLVYGGF